MFYLIKNPNGQYMSTGGQYVSSSGFMENPPVFVGDRNYAWCTTSKEFADDVVKRLKLDHKIFGLEIEEY